MLTWEVPTVARWCMLQAIIYGKKLFSKEGMGCFRNHRFICCIQLVYVICRIAWHSKFHVIVNSRRYKNSGLDTIFQTGGQGDRGSTPSGGKEGFSSSLCVQTGSGAHPVSCTMGTAVLSPGVKRSRGVILTTQPHLVPRSWMSRSYTSSPLALP
jgi:hypothetical protein